MRFVGALNLFFILWLATHLAHASRFRAQGGFGKYDGPPNRYLGPKSDENELPPDETESDGDVTKDLSDQPPSSMEKPRNRRPSPKSDENEAPPDKTESDGDVTKDLSDQPPPSMEKPRYGYDTREELSGSDFNSMDGPIPPGYPVLSSENSVSESDSSDSSDTSDSNGASDTNDASSTPPPPPPLSRMCKAMGEECPIGGDPEFGCCSGLECIRQGRVRVRFSRFNLGGMGVCKKPKDDTDEEEEEAKCKALGEGCTIGGGSENSCCGDLKCTDQSRFRGAKGRQWSIAGGMGVCQKHGPVEGGSMEANGYGHGPHKPSLAKFHHLLRKKEGLIDCLNWASIVRHNPRSLKIDQFRVKTSWCLPKVQPDQCETEKFKFLKTAFIKYGWDEAFCHVKQTGVVVVAGITKDLPRNRKGNTGLRLTKDALPKYKMRKNKRRHGGLKPRIGSEGLSRKFSRMRRVSHKRN